MRTAQRCPRETKMCDAYRICRLSRGSYCLEDSEIYRAASKSAPPCSSSSVSSAACSPSQTIAASVWRLVTRTHAMQFASTQVKCGPTRSADAGRPKTRAKYSSETSRSRPSSRPARSMRTNAGSTPMTRLYAAMIINEPDAAKRQGDENRREDGYILLGTTRGQRGKASEVGDYRGGPADELRDRCRQTACRWSCRRFQQSLRPADLLQVGRWLGSLRLDGVGVHEDLVSKVRNV